MDIDTHRDIHVDRWSTAINGFIERTFDRLDSIHMHTFTYVYVHTWTCVCRFCWIVLVSYNCSRYAGIEHTCRYIHQRSYHNFNLLPHSHISIETYHWHSGGAQVPAKTGQSWSNQSILQRLRRTKTRTFQNCYLNTLIFPCVWDGWLIHYFFFIGVIWSNQKIILTPQRPWLTFEMLWTPFHAVSLLTPVTSSWIFSMADVNLGAM